MHYGGSRHLECMKPGFLLHSPAAAQLTHAGCESTQASSAAAASLNKSSSSAGHLEEAIKGTSHTQPSFTALYRAEKKAGEGRRKVFSNVS